MAYTVKAGNRAVEISNPEKVLFPDDSVTKTDLVDYYDQIASTMIPEMKNRLVTMERYPDGIHQEPIIQKDVSRHFPDWVPRKTVPKEGRGRVTHVVCQNRATLVYLANQACITPHVTLSRDDRLDHPDQMVFDLDPSSGSFAEVRRTALTMRELIDELGLVSFAKATGSRGIHVIVPLNRRHAFDEVRAFARSVARYLADEDPERLTVEMRKEKRRDRIFIDWLRNARGQTAVAYYAVRARPGAPVAMPLGWDEVEDPKLKPDRYSMKDALGEVANGRDPFKGWRRFARSLTGPARRLERLSSDWKMQGRSVRTYSARLFTVAAWR